MTGMIDPDFSIDPSGAADLVFGNLFSGSGTRTLTYRVDSTLGNTVTVDSISLVDDGDGSFSIDSVTPSLPAVLADGDTLDLEVTAANAQPGTYTGVIQVDTTTTGLLGADAYDTALPLSAGIFVNGQVLNTNPYMDANLGGWGGGSSFVEGGIAPGSVGMARVKGLGDPAGGNPDALFQTAIVDGAEDWTMICYFTPIDIANFASYVDPDGTNGITGPDGAFTDRTFQWVLLGADASSPTPTFGDTEAADAIINLAYLPDGISTGGTPDFYVYDGSSWVATGIGAIQGSVDNDTDGDPLNGFGDGLLDTAVDPADSINVYKLTVSGTGFGTGSASYDLQIDKISGGDSFTTGNATGLSAFHSLSGNTTAPAAHAFITSDETSSSAFDAPYATSFWVDDAAFVNGTPADPSLTFLSVPTTALAFDPDTTGISTFRVRNDGSSNPLVINAPTFASPALGVTPPASIAPGAFADIPVSFDSLVGGSATEEFATLTSNASLNGSAEFLFNGATVGFSQLVPNFDFEVPGTDAAGDTNTFATWDEAVDAGSLADTDPAASRDVPGLIAGSATACYLDSSVGVPNIGNAFAVGVTDFVMEFPFAVKNTTGRQMALLLLGDTPVGKINLRYQGGEISAFSGGWQPLVTVALSPSEDADDNGSLDDIGDTKNVYKLRITGTGFGTAPSYSVEVLDLSNTVLGSTASPVSIFQDEFGAGVRAGEIIFSSEFGNNPGWWVDDASLSGAIVTDPNIVISAISKSGGTVTMDFTSAVNVDVYKSTDLTTFGASPILSDVAPGTGVTVDASATEPSAFYVLVPTGDPAP